MTPPPRRSDSDDKAEMWKIIHETRDKANSNQHDMRSHEALCSERFNGILKQLGAQEEILKFQNRLMITSAIGMIAGLVGVVGAMFLDK